jgi:hypothetical protein
MISRASAWRNPFVIEHNDRRKVVRFRLPKIAMILQSSCICVDGSPSVREKGATVAVQTFRRGVRSQPQRWQAWYAVIATLALLAFFGDVGRTGHLLLTHHVRCPYDGALVHDDELPPSARATGAETSARTPLPVSAVPRHEHHDCDACGAVHRFSAVIVPGQGEVCRAEVSALSAQSDVQQRVARSVLSYAPKLSPPA